MMSQIELPVYVIDKIREIAAKYYGGTENADNLRISRASKNGDSYSGDVYRVAVPSQSQESDQCTNTMKELSLIVKTPPKTAVRRQMYNSGAHFEREHYIYETVLPAFEQLQRFHNITDEKIFNNYPVFYGASSVPNNEYVILSDGIFSGYLNAIKTEPLDANYCTAVLKNLANFHAISFAYKDQKPDEFKSLTSGVTELMFKDPIHQTLDEFIKRKIPYAIDTLDQPGDEGVKQRLLELHNCIGQRMVECCSEQEDAVLLHGDCWISNLLFKGSEPEVLFLDWQVARYGTVAIDISYFVFNCTDAELRKDFDGLMQMYYKTLIQRINELGSNGEQLFPWKKFQWHLNKYCVFGLGMAFMSLHATVVPAEELPDVDETLEKIDMSNLEQFLAPMVKRPAYRLRMSGICRDCSNLGFI